MEGCAQSKQNTPHSQQSIVKVVVGGKKDGAGGNNFYQSWTDANVKPSQSVLLKNNFRDRKNVVIIIACKLEIVAVFVAIRVRAVFSRAIFIMYAAVIVVCVAIYLNVVQVLITVEIALTDVVKAADSVSRVGVIIFNLSMVKVALVNDVNASRLHIRFYNVQWVGEKSGYGAT